MEFVASINLSHTDVVGVSHFLCDHLGFSLVNQDNTSITVNNGALGIRFVRDSNSDNIVCLDLETTNMGTGAEKLVSLGFEPTNEMKRTEMFRDEQRFTGPFGLTISLHKVLTEDDLGIQPDLDLTLDWEEYAEELAKTLITHVAIHFRNSARKKMVKQAEALALVEGNTEVSVDDMVTAFLYTTPYFKQDDLQKLLLDHGISKAFIEEQIQNM